MAKSCWLLSMITASKIPIDCTDFAKVYISFLKCHFRLVKRDFTELTMDFRK